MHVLQGFILCSDRFDLMMFCVVQPSCGDIRFFLFQNTVCKQIYFGTLPGPNELNKVFL